jgi:formylglycine-generating enzyme required for sulfatase activity
VKKFIYQCATLLLALMSFAHARAGEVNAPETVTIDAGFFMYRASGEFLKDNYPIDAPLLHVAFDASFEIMRYQVLAVDYGKCVEEKSCSERLNPGHQDGSLPVTGVSYQDAVDYAQWLSRKTGVTWRLPSDQEWAFAAGSRFVDDAINLESNRDNPAERWLAKYRKNADLGLQSDPVIKASGYYGANENGIYDLSGNVWEWTDSCYVRTRMDGDGKATSETENCGVRIAAGLHRAYLSFFIQDAKGGGCSVGKPPDYLGFRLIREPSRSMMDWLRNAVGLGEN